MMKDLVKSGKIWTLLSAFIFMMTCGLVVYAATTNGVKFAVDYKKSEKDSLTYTEWNNLMGDMDNIVPKGAIMIFDSASGCPAGWTQWNNSNGKFIMGATSLSSNRTGGANQVKILLENIPAHTHYYKDTVYSETRGGEPESTNYYLNRGDFTQTDEANKYPISDYQYLDHGEDDIPDPLNIIKGDGVIVGSDEGGDVDNYPIFGLRMTSYEVCGNVGDEVVTARKAMRRGAEATNIGGKFGNLAKGKFADKVHAECYRDEDTIGPINPPAKAGNKPISIQNEYYTVIFCKKN